VLVGDAAGLIDPMSGEGIENAFRSAECAAEIIQQTLVAGDFSLSFLMKYEKALESLLRPELRIRIRDPKGVAEFDFFEAYLFAFEILLICQAADCE
jgi:flavin-dependent dehydrogenase